MKTLTLGLYWVFGTLALAAGIAALAMPTVILSPDMDSGLTRHLVREEAALFVFVGLMCFWCAKHYDQRRYVHLSLLTFLALFAGVHWIDVFRGGGLIGPLVNAIPPLLLAVTAPFSKEAV
jgi:hypothetical protein